MDCRMAQSRLVDFVDGGLTPRTARALEGHIASCAACREELEAIRAFDGLAAEFLVAPEPNYTTADLLARLDAAETAPALEDAMPALEVRRAAPHFAAALIMLLSAAGFNGALRLGRSAVVEPREAIAQRMLLLDEALVEAAMKPPEEDRTARG